MPKLAETIGRLEGFIIDMDGVLYRGEKPIKGAARAVEAMRRKGKKLVFWTNNSAYTRRAYARRLTRMGIASNESEIITSGYATAFYLRKRAPRAKLYVVGELGLKQELKEADFILLSDERAAEATHVVAGLDRTLSYKKITAALSALLAGAEFVATNVDSTYPTEAGLSPGAGATVGALSGCSGKKPVVIGKPSVRMLKLALDVLGTKPRETAIVGDRIDTDIAVGKRMGLTTILVLSGVTAERDVARVRGTKLAPDFVLSSIKVMEAAGWRSTSKR